MQLEYIPYLLEIDRQKSVSAAARTFGLRQTTLSSILSSLEEEVGFSIFCRTPNGMVPTALGEKLLSTAREINVQMEELHSLATREKGHTQPVRLLVTPGTGTAVALELTKRFHPFELNTDLFFDEHTRGKIPPLIKQCDANLGLVFLTEDELEDLRMDLEDSGVHLSVMLTTHFCALVRADHPLAQKEELTETDLLRYRVCSVTGCSLSGRHSFFRWIDQHSQPTCVTSFHLLCSLVEDDRMIGIVPLFTMQAGGLYDPARFRLLRLPMNIIEQNVSVCLLHREPASLRYQEKILLNCIEDFFQSYSPETAEQTSEGGAEG